MSLSNCTSRINCTLAGLIAAVIIGVIGAFLQITGVITLTAAFLWAALGIAVVYLGILLVSSALPRETQNNGCMCAPLNALLAGILGTILFSVILLAVGITATSVISAILAGLLLFFLTLIFTGAACLVRCLGSCES